MTKDDEILTNLTMGMADSFEVKSESSEKQEEPTKKQKHIKAKQGRIYTVEPSKLAMTPMPGARQSQSNAVFEQ